MILKFPKIRWGRIVTLKSRFKGRKIQRLKGKKWVELMKIIDEKE